MRTDAIACWGGKAQLFPWLTQVQGRSPLLAVLLAFTETALIPGISAAGKTPRDRRYTAHADAEFLYNGPNPQPQYPLPPLQAGASPVLITRACVEQLATPLFLIDAGLTQPLPVPAIRLNSQPARCLSTGQAMPIAIAQQLFQQGQAHGAAIAAQHPDRWLVLGECVVGGTSTALALLLALGIEAAGCVSSSHPTCNHGQKLALVQQGLAAIPDRPARSPLELAAAIADPMLIAAAGMAMAVSQTQSVLLAGGTQMLAAYALMAAIAQTGVAWQPDRIAVGTTRWVMVDPSAQVAQLGPAIASRFGWEPLLLSTQLNFQRSRHAQLQVYEQGFVKEGVAAGGMAIAASLATGASVETLRQWVDDLGDRAIAASGIASAVTD
ncbi:nicotinate mononucleotide-dependent phosphoribosyltransferase CobT [Synechococcus elongatus]|uniref:nicotinate mononucleotide-dependent phosphoribosyltransferase CobT n=1 Tax=Synechococcus elongatus TaxID=32046 RepID=UPI000F7FA0A8|nr:TIGR00303 family protein [Synechococcus elongatus]